MAAWSREFETLPETLKTQFNKSHKGISNENSIHECAYSSDVRRLGYRPTFHGAAPHYDSASNIDSKCPASGEYDSSHKSQHDAAAYDHRSADADHHQGRWAECLYNAPGAGPRHHHAKQCVARNEWNSANGIAQCPGSHDLRAGERNGADNSACEYGLSFFAERQFADQLGRRKPEWNDACRTHGKPAQHSERTGFGFGQSHWWRLSRWNRT